MASGDRYTLTGTVREVRSKSVALEPPAMTRNQALCWVPRSQILDADCDLDEVERGDELTVEVPLWFARKEGLTDE